MIEKLRSIIKIKFIASTILFLMPFINISCGTVNVTFSGMELAFGTTYKQEAILSGGASEKKFEAQPTVTFALTMALFGVVFGFFKRKPALLGSLIAGASGALSLIYFTQWIANQKGGNATVHFLFWFWLVVILFFGAAGLSLYALSLQSDPKLE